MMCPMGNMGDRKGYDPKDKQDIDLNVRKKKTKQSSISNFWVIFFVGRYR